MNNEELKSCLGVRKYKKEFLIIFLITGISVGCVFLSTNYLSQIIDKTVNGSYQLSTVAIGLVSYFIIQTVMMGINVLYSYMSGTIRKSILSKIRIQLLDVVLEKMPFSTYKEIGKKKLISIFINDIGAYGSNYYVSVIGLINNYFRLAVFLVLMFYYHYTLGIILLISIVILWFSTKHTNKMMEECSDNQAKAKETFLSEYENIIQGWIDYKTARKDLLMANKLIKVSEECEHASLKYEDKSVLVYGLNSLAKVLIIGLFFTVEIYLGFHSYISIGKIIVSISIISLIQDELDAIISNLQELSAAKPIRERITHVLAGDCRLDKSNNINPMWRRIGLRNISFSYDNNAPILSNFSYEFERGKSYAIVGRSGIGKSTIVKIMLGLIKDYSGYVYIDDRSLNEGSEELIEISAYLDQELYLFEDTIENNIYFGNEKAKIQYKNHQLIRLLDQYFSDYSYEVKENGSNLSGGQRQLIGIARAIVKGKKVMIFDETFSAIDEELFKEVETLLMDLEDITYITITHRNVNMAQYSSILHMEGKL